MAETAYIGVNGVAQKLSKMYVGDSNGVARKVTKGYIGVNGVARLFYTAHIHAYLDQSSYDFDDYINEDQHYYTKTCSCGDTITVWEDHGYDEYEEEATCTSDGYYMEFCPDCQKEFYYKTYPALGHTIETVEYVNLEPTCTEEGIMNYSDECSVCGEEIGGWSEPIPALGHAYKPTTVPATCTERGYTQHTCTRCDDSYNDSYAPALGHQMVYTGRYTTDGYEWMCMRPDCGHTEFRPSTGV